MIPTAIIEKAMAGGWMQLSALPHEIRRIQAKKYTSRWHTLCYDKTFWQALGVSFKWDETKRHRFNGRMLCMSEFNAHRFYDLVLTEGDPDKFWEEFTS